MKRRVLAFARAAGLMRYADRVLMMRSRSASRERNLAFEKSHPGFAMPPDDLAFDAYNHVDRTEYFDVGRRHAEVYAGVIAANEARPDLAILEWGCGPGRIIRHMRDCLPGRALALTGSDFNARSIAWSRKFIPGIDFVVNDFMPKLPFADGSFDVTVNCSVFTHLSEASQLAWSGELFRVLRPGGLLVCSTHGDNYREHLEAPHETAIYDAGGLVVRARYQEGKKWFLAFQPPSWVRENLLVSFREVRAVAVPAEARLAQDVWSARKPA